MITQVRGVSSQSGRGPSDVAGSRLPAADSYLRLRRRSARGDAVSCGVLHVVGFNLGRALQRGLEYVLNLRKGLAMIALSIFPGLPEADSHHALGVLLRGQGDFIHKPRLLLQQGQ